MRPDKGYNKISGSSDICLSFGLAVHYESV